MNMVERVARAMWEDRRFPHVVTPWEDLAEPSDARTDFRRLARAAIAAMREPTEAMKLAGLHGLVEEIEREQAGMTPLVPPKHIEGDTYEVPDAEAPQRYMRLGSLLRNSRETNAAYYAMIDAALSEPQGTNTNASS